ncbi:MAG: PIN domain-containing protein [Bryobacteraceae bacterium]
MGVRTYVDSSVLIAAWRGEETIQKRALGILLDEERHLLVSDLLRLEVLPKPKFHRRFEEEQFMLEILALGEDVDATGSVTRHALSLASKYNLSAIDALHAAAAIQAKADEFVTLEKPDKPLCKITELRVVSLATRAS